MTPIADISNVAGLLEVLQDHRAASDIWYRGQSYVEWKLLPSLGRTPETLAKETNLIARFKQSASLLLQPLPANDWEWLTIMQHYRVPTRLLDWTESPLVALYFAVDESDSRDGSLWVLNPAQLNLESNIKPDIDGYIPYLGEELTENYLPEKLQSERFSKLDPIAVIGPRNNPRMQAQLGVFTVIHREAKPIECIGARRHVTKFRVPGDAKSHIRKELSTLSLNKFQLFPDLQSLGDILRSEI